MSRRVEWFDTDSASLDVGVRGTEVGSESVTDDAAVILTDVNGLVSCVLEGSRSAIIDNLEACLSALK